MKKRLLSVLLALVMVLGLLPAGALALEGEADAAHTHTVDGESVTFDHTLTGQETDGGDGEKTYTFEVDGSAPDVMNDDTIVVPAGSYRMESNITMPYRDADNTTPYYLKLSDGVNLCTNGHTLDLHGNAVSMRSGAVRLFGCGNGCMTNNSIVIEVFEGTSPNLCELVVESGKFVSTQAVDAVKPNGAIVSSGGYTTLKGGAQVEGPYGVKISRKNSTAYTKALLTLVGAPKVKGKLADILIENSIGAVNAKPYIDATGYTGDALKVKMACLYTTMKGQVGAPIVKLGDNTPASKFTLVTDEEGYTLAEKTVDGVKCLVLAEKSALQAKWGADAENLTGEGSLADALTAAAAENSAVAYIQLADNVTAADGETFTAEGGTFTLDLNGHTLTGGKGGDTSNAAAIGKPGLTVDGADVTVTGTGTLRGGQGGAYNDNMWSYGGRGVQVKSGKLTVDSDGVNVTTGLPGESCTADAPASSTHIVAMEIWGGEVVLQAGTVDASEKKDGDSKVIQSGGTAIVLQGGLLTAPQNSTLRATAAGGDCGLLVMAAAETANIAGGTFGGVHGDDQETLPQRGIDVSAGTCNISGGSFSGSFCGLNWGGSGQVTLSGGYYYAAGNNAVSVSGDATYADLLKAGCGWFVPGDTVITDEEEIKVQSYLAVIPTPHTHAVSVDCSTETGKQVKFEAWDKTDSLPATGNYYLTKDVTLTESASLTMDVNLCLNGHTVTSSRNPTISYRDSSTLAGAICDCGKGGTISIQSGAAIAVESGSLHLYGGTVTSPQVGVSVLPDGTFHMHGGKVKGGSNAATGVSLQGGTLLMDGGTISGNNKGVRVDSRSTFRVEGDVVITDNTQNVVLDSQSHMELSGSLGLGAKIGLSEYSWSNVDTAEDGHLLAVQGAGDYSVTASDLAKLSSDNDDYQLTLGEDGKVYFSKKSTTTTHTHAWATAWTSDAAHHWHECTAQGCDIEDYSACNERDAEYGVHAASGNWQSDATNHWKDCIVCGYDMSKTPHVYDDDADTDCNTCGYIRTVTPGPGPDDSQTKGDVDIKGEDTPAVSVDKESLKDLAGEVSQGQSVTVTLTVEKQDAPADKAELEGVITGKKDDVLYLDLSLVKTVDNGQPTPITDTQDKVLEIAVPYDFTGKTDVTVYRKHGGDPAEKLTRLAARPTQDLQDGTFFADSAGGKVYIYASKFSTYAIGYTAVENLVSAQAPALYLGGATPIPCDGSTVDLPGGGTAVFRELGEIPGGGKVYGLTLENANITGAVRLQMGMAGTELVYGAGALFLGDRKDTLVVTLKGENTIAVTGADTDDRIAALAVPGCPVTLVGDGSLTAKATAVADKEAYGVSGKDLAIYAPLTSEGSTNAMLLTGSVTVATALDVDPAGARSVTETPGESGRASTTLELDGQPLTHVAFTRRVTPLAPLYLDGVAIQPDGERVNVGGGTATLTQKEGAQDYTLTLEGVNATHSVKLNGSYAGLLFLGDTAQSLFPTASLTIHLADDVSIDVSDDTARMGLDLGGFPMSGFESVCTGIVAAGQLDVTVEGPGSLTVSAAATGEDFQACGVNAADLTVKTAADITAPDGAVCVTGDLTLGGGYAVTRPKRYTLTPSGSYGKFLMDGDAPAMRVTVEKVTAFGGSSGGGYVPPTVVYTPGGKTTLPFTDVAKTDSFYDAVKYVYENKLMLGTSETTFEPQGQLTRAMLATILYRQAGSPKVEGTPEFTDTLADAWYSDAIVWAAQTQVLRGYGNGKFGPEDPVSKEMMNLVAARQAGEDPSWTGDPALAVPATRAEIAQLLLEQKGK